MGKAEWGFNPVFWWLGLYFCFVCLYEASNTGCYWCLGDARPCIKVVSFVWVLTIWYSVGGLQSMGLLRVGHNWEISLSCLGGGNGNPLEFSCLENPRDREARWAAVYGVTQSRTRLKWLSSSSSSRVSSLIVYGLGGTAPTPKSQGLISGQEWRFYKWFVMAVIKTN